MKILKKLIALALVLASVMSISAVALADTTMYVNVTPNVNFRQSPGGALIDRIPYGAAVTQHSTSTVNGVKWSYVTYNGTKGYVQSQYLSSTRPGGSTGHPTSEIDAFGKYTLQKGQTSYYVMNLQMALNQCKLTGISTLKVDGVFGSGTLEAVKKFQEKHNLTVDGLVGSATKAKLWELQGEYLSDNGVMSM